MHQEPEGWLQKGRISPRAETFQEYHLSVSQYLTLNWKIEAQFIKMSESIHYKDGKGKGIGREVNGEKLESKRFRLNLMKTLKTDIYCHLAIKNKNPRQSLSFELPSFLISFIQHTTSLHFILSIPNISRGITSQKENFEMRKPSFTKKETSS